MIPIKNNDISNNAEQHLIKERIEIIERRQFPGFSLIYGTIFFSLMNRDIRFVGRIFSIG